MLEPPLLRSLCALLALLLLNLGGCGNKGPLYLPEAAPARPAAGEPPERDKPRRP